MKIILQKVIDGHMKQELMCLKVTLQQPFARIKDDECSGNDGEEGYWKVFERAEKVTEKNE